MVIPRGRLNRAAVPAPSIKSCGAAREGGDFARKVERRLRFHGVSTPTAAAGSEDQCKSQCHDGSEWMYVPFR